MSNPKPVKRPRRLRTTETMRSLVRETTLDLNDLVNPFFVVNGEGVTEKIDSMPGVFRYSVDKLLAEIKIIYDLGIKAVLLFGIPAYKDAGGSSAYDSNEAVQRAAAAIKDRFPEIFVVTDVCLCEYTDHGHCGLVDEGRILNDQTVEILTRVALSHARAGADAIAPSDMMDGRVAAIRSALDREGYEEKAIISYAVKYASAFYGPFRDAAGSAPRFGDRRAYQMDPPNIREALKEALLDVEEAADIIMVKPALAYLDVIRAVRETVNCPVATYNVSGEYSMVKAAAANGWVDEQRIVFEQLIAMKRAGADLIFTYHAKEVARWLQQIS